MVTLSVLKFVLMLISLGLSEFSLGLAICNFTMNKSIQKMNDIVQRMHSVNQTLIKNYEAEKESRESLKQQLLVYKQNCQDNREISELLKEEPEVN